MAEPTTPEEFKEWLEKQAELLDKGVITQQDYNNAVKDASVQMKGYAATLKASQDQLKKSFTDLGASILKGEEGAAVYNNTINATADTISSFLSKIPYVGKLLGTLVEAGGKYAAAVNLQADALFKNYKELSRNGLATGLQDTFENLQDMGYTAAEIGNMSALVKENANTLANFGGTAAQGAKMFAKAAKDIQYSDIGNQFKLMGMSVDDINKGIAGYSKIQMNSGTLQKQNAEQVAQSAAEYMMKQDKLTKLTGISADQQNSIIDAAMADQRYAATQSEMRKNGDAMSLAIAARNDELLTRFQSEAGPKTAKMFQDYASGMMNSEDAQKFRRTFGNAAQMIDSGVTDTDSIMKAARSDANKVQRDFTTQAKAGLANNNIGDFAETVKIAGNELNKNMELADKTADSEQNRQKAGADKGAKNMVDITNSQRNQTMTTDKLTNIGIVPVTKGMALLAEGLENATDVVGQLAGRKERVGGGQTAVGSAISSVNKSINSFLGGGGGSSDAKGGGPNLSVGGDQTKVKVGEEVREGGNINWRNNNPGNIRPGPFATSMGAIGQNGGFAVFPTMEMGRKAADTLLQSEKYANLTAAQALQKWAPAADNNDPAKYAADLSKKTGIDMTRKYADLNPEERSKFLDAMNKIEGGKAGTVMAANGAAPKQQAANGGVLTGPKSGYEATLHGTEAVIPLPDGKTIPVQMKGNTDSYEQTKLLTAELDKLESLLRVMQQQNDISNQLLQRQS